MGDLQGRPRPQITLRIVASFKTLEIDNSKKGKLY